MIVSLTAVFAALAIGLPILALGERIRERRESATRSRGTTSTRKDI